MSSRRGFNEKRTSRNALRANKMALEKEGFNIGQSFNLFKDSQARALPQSQVFKEDLFKYAGDIEEDYNAPGRLGESIRNPSAPPDDFNKIVRLLPKNMWKASALTGRKRMGDTYANKKLTRVGPDGRVRYSDNDNDGKVDTEVNAGHPTQAVRLNVDQFSGGQLLQNAEENFRQNVNLFKQPRFEFPNERTLHVELDSRDAKDIPILDDDESGASLVNEYQHGVGRRLGETNVPPQPQGGFQHDGAVRVSHQPHVRGSDVPKDRHHRRNPDMFAPHTQIHHDGPSSQSSSSSTSSAHMPPQRAMSGAQLEAVTRRDAKFQQDNLTQLRNSVYFMDKTNTTLEGVQHAISILTGAVSAGSIDLPSEQGIMGKLEEVVTAQIQVGGLLSADWQESQDAIRGMMANNNDQLASLWKKQFAAMTRQNVVSVKQSRLLHNELKAMKGVMVDGFRAQRPNDQSAPPQARRGADINMAQPVRPPKPTPSGVKMEQFLAKVRAKQRQRLHARARASGVRQVDDVKDVDPFDQAVASAEGLGGGGGGDSQADRDAIRGATPLLPKQFSAVKRKAPPVQTLNEARRLLQRIDDGKDAMKESKFVNDLFSQLQAAVARVENMATPTLDPIQPHQMSLPALTEIDLNTMSLPSLTDIDINTMSVPPSVKLEPPDEQRQLADLEVLVNMTRAEIMKMTGGSSRKKRRA